MKIEVLRQKILENKNINIPIIEVPPLPLPPPLQIPDLEDLAVMRDRILEGLTKGRGSFARTSPQYKAAVKALDRFIETMQTQKVESNE